MHRYELSDKEEQIQEDVEHLFDVNPVSREIDISEYNWEIDWVNLDELDVETESHKEQSNVALRERRVAVEKAQLTVGEGNPIIVVGEDNILIEGFTRYNLLRNHFEESPIPVYRAMPKAEVEADVESETANTVSASE